MGGRFGGGFNGGALISVVSLVTFLACFGGGRGRQRAARGADLRYNMDLTAERCVLSVTKGSVFRRWGVRRLPRQRRESWHPQPQTCPRACHGSGRVRCAGIFAVRLNPAHCQGRGTLIKIPCANVAVVGVLKKVKTLSVKIPGEVDTGDRIRRQARAKRASMARRQATRSGSVKQRLFSVRGNAVRSADQLRWRRSAVVKCRR